MEASALVFAAFLSPQAIFHKPLNLCTEHQMPLLDDHSIPDDSKWSCDGVDIDNARFYAVPEFAVGLPPLRVDVYIPDPALCMQCQSCHDTEIKIQHPMRRIRREHLLPALARWSASVPQFKERYLNLPFGSSIVVQDLDSASIYMRPDYSAEQRSMALEELSAAWGLEKASCPVGLNISELQLRHQPHDAIGIVTINSRHGEQLFVFKSAARQIQFLYHELRMLILADGAKYLMPAPLYVVSKRGKFGNKLGVVGFILPYETGGSLYHNLTTGRIDSVSLGLQKRYIFALELTLGVISICESKAGYSPDLKPQNILVGFDLIGNFHPLIIDLEQRGGPLSFAPPEIRYVDHIESLVQSDGIPEDVLHRYTSLLDQLGSPCKYRDPRRPYSADITGFSYSWQILSPAQREKAMVFVLGKIFWCIFELQSTPNWTMGLDKFQDIDGGLRFPDFVKASCTIRNLIESCTADASRFQNDEPMLVIRNDKLLPPDAAAEDIQPQLLSSMEQVARQWWTREIELAEDYFKQRFAGRSVEMITGSHRRPSLRDIVQALQSCVHVPEGS